MYAGTTKDGTKQHIQLSLEVQGRKPGGGPAREHLLWLTCCWLKDTTHCSVRVMFSVPAFKVSDRGDMSQHSSSSSGVRSACKRAYKRVYTRVYKRVSKRVYSYTAAEAAQ